jgi:ABC-type branched-subunit amino acid transport system substrate-binding protein
MSRLAQAFQQVGYRPQVPFYGAQAYGNQFLELAGPAAEGTVIAVTHNLFEDAGAVPAVATFLDHYRSTAPGSDPDFFSVMAWAAADMLVQAIRAAGPAPTRDAVLAHLRTQTAFTAEGLLSPRNPAAKDTGDCFAVITVQGGAWRRLEPAAGFVNC